MPNDNLLGPPFVTKEKRVALIESVKDIVVASIRGTPSGFDGDKEYAQQAAAMFYTTYNDMIKNVTNGL